MPHLHKRDPLENDTECRGPGWAIVHRKGQGEESPRRHEMEIGIRAAEELEAERRKQLLARRNIDAAKAEETSTEPTILRAVTAQLAVFEDYLSLKHGPILVVLETWSDGLTVARWPEGRFHGEGSCDADAIRDLAENIEEFVMDTHEILKTHKLAGAALEQWRAIAAMFDVYISAERAAQ